MGRSLAKATAERNVRWQIRESGVPRGREAVTSRLLTCRSGHAKGNLARLIHRSCESDGCNAKPPFEFINSGCETNLLVD